MECLWLIQIVIRNFFDSIGPNYEIYNTSPAEIAEMYDRYRQAKSLGLNLETFLEREGATKHKKIVCDRKVEIYDKESRKNIKVAFPFKYPVYSFIDGEFQKMRGDLQRKDNEAMQNLVEQTTPRPAS